MLALRHALTFCLLCLAACGTEDDAALAPFDGLDTVGAPCATSSECGPPNAVCLLDFPGGYCGLPCFDRTDCPNGAECIPYGEQAICAAGCGSSADCRTDYVCQNRLGLDGYEAAVCVAP